MVGWGVELPLPLFNRIRARWPRLWASLPPPKSNLQSVENDLITALNQALNNYQLAASNAALYKSEIMPGAEQQYKNSGGLLQIRPNL